MDEKIEQILREKPFSRIMTIKDIKSLYRRGALSGQSFMIIDDRELKYKLRLCDDENQASRIERNVKMLSKAFPHFYGREGRYVLFQWVDGESWNDMLTHPIPKEFYYQLGKLVGEAHALNDVDESKSADGFFDAMVSIIDQNKKLNKKILSGIRQKYKDLKEKIRVDVLLEIDDIHPQNFMIQNRNNPEKIKIYFVDEDGFGHKIKGLGLAKPFFIEGVIKTKEQVDSFWRGYNEHHSNDFFDKDYQEFVTFVQVVRSLAARSKDGRDPTDLIRLINTYL